MAENIEVQIPLPLANVGARLRAAREEAGLSRAAVGERTKIPERHLIAMEDGDFAALPARAYAIGFTRSYARAVGLNEHEIVASLRAELGGAEDRDAPRVSAFEPGDPSRVPSRRTAWLAAAGAFIVIVAGFFLWQTFYMPATEPPLATPQQPVPAATQPNPVAAQPQGPVTFTAAENGVRVRFHDSLGNTLLDKELAAGESYTLPLDAVDALLSTARPDALRVTIGGSAVPPLALTRTSVRNMPVSASALLSRAQNANTVSASDAATPGAARPSVMTTTPARTRSRPEVAVELRAGSLPVDARPLPVGSEPVPATSTSPAPETSTDSE